MTFWLISPYPRREKYFGATVIKNTNSDKINFELWADNMFSITNTQPESAISIGQLNWQGMNAICNFTAISKVLINYYNINLYKKITRASNEKKVNLLIYTVSFVKQQNMILQRLAFVISRTFFHQAYQVLVHFVSSRINSIRNLKFNAFNKLSQDSKSKLVPEPFEFIVLDIYFIGDHTVDLCIFSTR